MSVRVAWVPTPELDRFTAGLRSFDAILCSPGTPCRSMSGALPLSPAALVIAGCAPSAFHRVPDGGDGVSGYACKGRAKLVLSRAPARLGRGSFRNDHAGAVATSQYGSRDGTDDSG